MKEKERKKGHSHEDRKQKKAILQSRPAGVAARPFRGMHKYI
jgi:hypothetical protein